MRGWFRAPGEGGPAAWGGLWFSECDGVGVVGAPQGRGGGARRGRGLVSPVARAVPPLALLSGGRFGIMILPLVLQRKPCYDFSFL